MELTVDEAVAYLSSRTHLPTLAVEGKHDAQVFRAIESQLRQIGVDVLPLGGKNSVLGVFGRRTEFTNCARIVFLVDQDTWLFEGVPEETLELVHTFGYSIENDVVCREVVCELTGDHGNRLLARLSEMSRWFGAVVVQHLHDRTTPLTRDPTLVLDGDTLSVEAQGQVASTVVPQQIADLLANPWMALRGKTLLRCIEDTLAVGSGVRYRGAQILDLSIKLGRSTRLSALCEKIARRFGN